MRKLWYWINGAGPKTLEKRDWRILLVSIWLIAGGVWFDFLAGLLS